MYKERHCEWTFMWLLWITNNVSGCSIHYCWADCCEMITRFHACQCFFELFVNINGFPELNPLQSLMNLLLFCDIYVIAAIICKYIYGIRTGLNCFVLKFVSVSWFSNGPPQSLQLHMWNLLCVHHDWLLASTTHLYLCGSASLQAYEDYVWIMLSDAI